jgi:hypothetical protein
MKWWPQELPGWTPPKNMPTQLALAPVATRLAPLPMIQVHHETSAHVFDLAPAQIVPEALPAAKSADDWAWLGDL